MFKCAEYIGYDKNTNCHIYKLIDTNFECEVLAPVIHYAEPTMVSVSGASAVLTAAGVALGYKQKNYSHEDICTNLFKCNIYLCNKFKCSFEEILKFEDKYIDQNIRGVDFSNTYYKDLKDMWDKYNIYK
jgi:hypothetical protein